MNLSDEQYENLPAVIQKIVDIDREIDKLLDFQDVLPYAVGKQIRAMISEREMCVKVANTKWGRTADPNKKDTNLS